MKTRTISSLQDSGLPWAPMVPRDWEVLALKHVVELRSGNAITAEQIGEAGDYPVFGGNGLRGFTSCFTHDGAFPLIGRQGALCGNINYATGRFYASEHAVVATPKRACAIRWLGELLRVMNLGQYSVSAAQPGIAVEAIKELKIPVPPPSEQTAIAAFLDRETAKIDALVEEQRRLIALLAEKRQAVISHAVTKGLDPTVPMKDSGVEWLGEVPAHWEVARLKHISPEITVGIVVEPSKYYMEHGVPALRSLNVRQGRIDTDNLVFISPDSNKSLRKSRLSAGDLVSVRTGQPGTTAVIPPNLDGCNCIDLIIIRRPIEGDENYLSWYLASDVAVRQFADGSGGAIQQHFNVSVAGDLVVCVPSLPEQTKIAKFVVMETQKIDNLIAEAQSATNLLQERRAALISAAVTGKIDVRGLVPAVEEAA